MGTLLAIVGIVIAVILVILGVGKLIDWIVFNENRSKGSAGIDQPGVGLHERNGHTAHVPFTGDLGDGGSGDSGSTHV